MENWSMRNQFIQVQPNRKRWTRLIQRAIAQVCLLGTLLGLFWTGLTLRATADAEMTASAQARIYSTENPSELLGVATFVTADEGLQVNAELSDVPPGYHGFHIHEFGSCDDGGSAAGGHFNPLETQHGYLPDDGLDNAHAGDLGNIIIESNGTGTLQETIPPLPLMTGRLAIAQRAVIVHADRDDFGQPTGNAGGRIGCGIIELANESE